MLVIPGPGAKRESREKMANKGLEGSWAPWVLRGHSSSSLASLAIGGILVPPALEDGMGRRP